MWRTCLGYQQTISYAVPGEGSSTQGANTGPAQSDLYKTSTYMDVNPLPRYYYMWTIVIEAVPLHYGVRS